MRLSKQEFTLMWATRQAEKLHNLMRRLPKKSRILSWRITASILIPRGIKTFAHIYGQEITEEERDGVLLRIVQLPGGVELVQADEDEE